MRNVSTWSKRNKEEKLKGISPRTFETCAQETHEKRALTEHTPTDWKRTNRDKKCNHSSKKNGDLWISEWHLTDGTWYITSWKSTGNVRAASSSSFKLQWTRVSSWQWKTIKPIKVSSASIQDTSEETFHGLPDPRREKTLVCCGFSKVTPVCVLTALPSGEARAWWRSTLKSEKTSNNQILKNKQGVSWQSNNTISKPNLHVYSPLKKQKEENIVLYLCKSWQAKHEWIHWGWNIMSV